MGSFTFATAADIRFGAGASGDLDDLSSRLGRSAFVVTGTDPDRFRHLLGDVDVAAEFALQGEPSFDDARRAVEAARRSGADHVIGVGGGAVLDLAKAVAILAVSETDPLDHAEVIGGGAPLPERGWPWIAVPTTAGTGSEVTSNAVLASEEHRVKVSLRSPAMLATAAVVDPELTVSCPPAVTASSGMDALTQCLEPMTSRMANPLVDALALAGWQAGTRSLVRAVEHGDDLDARTDMALCSLLGGLSLANAKLGAVHGLAGVLGGVTGAAHGAICAALLRDVTAANIAALRERDPGNPALPAYELAAVAATGEREAESLVGWLDELRTLLGIQGLTDLGLATDDHDGVVEAARRASSMKGNPIELTRDELLAVLQAAS